MTLLHDRRLITILIATAAVLMAGAVAFATSWLPSVGGSSPKLPMVVTSRPVESPLTSVFASPTPAPAAVPATGSATATEAPASQPGATVRTPAVDPAPPKAAPKPAQPDREVITPPVREKDEDDDDDEHSAVFSPVRPLGIDGGHAGDAHDSEDARHESAGDDHEREEWSSRDGDSVDCGGDERQTERGMDSKSAR